MTTQEELLAALRGRYGDSQTAIADAMGITLARLNNYVRGIRKMDDDAVIAACELLGWNVQRYLGKHRAEHAKTPRARAFWRGWSTAATLLLFAVVPALNPAAAYTDAGASTNAQAMHYAKCWHALGRLLHCVTFGLFRGHSTTALLA